MKSDSHGINISPVEVLNISPHGIWILVKEIEYFLDHEQFPWFSNQPINKIFNVELLHENHLFWEDLDVDLDIDSIKHPEKYPLKAV